MVHQHNGFFGEDHASITLKDRFSRYLSNWPLVLVAIIVCVGAGILYLQMTPSKYLSSTSFIVKGEEEGKSVSQDLIESTLNGGKKEINLDNEMLLISSESLMERVVANNGFNISYFKKGLMKNADVYKNAPFILTAIQISDSDQSYYIKIKKFDTQGGILTDTSGDKEKSYKFEWNHPFSISGQQFELSHREGAAYQGADYIVQWQPVQKVASKFSDALIVKAYDIKTSVIQLSIKTENPEKGGDLLNALFDEFNRSDIEDRLKLFQLTIEFINDRLKAISLDLKGVESNLENYRGSNQLIDISDQSKQSLDLSGTVSKNITDLDIQQSVVEMILEYFNKPSNGNRLVPSSLGLNDATLATLISQYNELQLKKERESPVVAPNSTVMQDMNTQLGNLKSSILESLGNISRNLQMQKNNFEAQHNQNKDYLSTIPHDERMLQEIKRKQTITESLYIYLLQKREESAISGTAAKVSHYKQVDSASAYGPAEPNPVTIIAYTALLGLFIAFGWIYLSGLFSDKVSSRQEIIGRTSLSVLGYINHISKRDKHILPVLVSNAVGEQFRAIRTTVYSLLRNKNKKVILVTSSANEEGKSFISLNLAAAFAMPGKKVALLEFDIRRPTVAKKLNMDSGHGLTLYLTGEANNISEISYVVDNIPSLHIYPSGPIPLNPADLLSAGKLNHLFETLKENYDYIIVDSPPASMVSDSFILGEYSDMVLYIIRSQKTSKKQLDFISEAISNNSLNNVALILNDIKKSDNNGVYFQSDYKSSTSVTVLS
jgi:capsular exopolysaccharide synthesis family protein